LLKEFCGLQEKEFEGKKAQKPSITEIRACM
jgi:hypothetical protein